MRRVTPYPRAEPRRPSDYYARRLMVIALLHAFVEKPEERERLYRVYKYHGLSRLIKLVNEWTAVTPLYDIVPRIYVAAAEPTVPTHYLAISMRDSEQTVSASAKTGAKTGDASVGRNNTKVAVSTNLRVVRPGHVLDGTLLSWKHAATHSDRCVEKTPDILRFEGDQSVKGPLLEDWEFRRQISLCVVAAEAVGSSRNTRTWLRTSRHGYPIKVDPAEAYPAGWALPFESLNMLSKQAVGFTPKLQILTSESISGLRVYGPHNAFPLLKGHTEVPEAFMNSRCWWLANKLLLSRLMPILVVIIDPGVEPPEVEPGTYMLGISYCEEFKYSEVVIYNYYKRPLKRLCWVRYSPRPDGRVHIEYSKELWGLLSHLLSIGNEAAYLQEERLIHISDTFMTMGIKSRAELFKKYLRLGVALPERVPEMSFE